MRQHISSRNESGYRFEPTKAGSISTENQVICDDGFRCWAGYMMAYWKMELICRFFLSEKSER